MKSLRSMITPGRALSILVATLIIGFFVVAGVIISRGPAVTISFETYGGTDISAMRARQGAAIETPETPEKRGYAFNGWYLDEQFTHPFTFEEMPEEDITLYALWGPPEGLQLESIGQYLAVTGYQGDKEELYIPEHFYGFPVVAIGDVAFMQNQTLRSVHFPSTIEQIGQFIFLQAASLEAIFVDEDNERFTSVDGVLFDADMTELLIYPPAKPDATYAIPEGVVSIDHIAFAENTHLQTICFPSTLESFGEQIFFKTSSLEAIDVADDNTHFTSLDGVLFDDGMTTLLKYPEAKPDAEYTIPEGVVAVAARAAEDTRHLQRLTINASLETIGDYAFVEAEALESLLFEDPVSLTTIGDFSFYMASALESLTIPASVTDIGDGAFMDASALHTLVFEDGTALEKIKDATFAGASSLEELRIPEGIVEIGTYAFMDSAALTLLELPATLESIQAQAFTNARSLETVVFAEGSVLEFIGFRAFANAESLESFTCPDTVEVIANEAFKGAESLQNVVFGENSVLNHIGESAFEKSALTTFDLPDSVETIAQYAFAFTKHMTAFNIGEDSNLELIGNGVFFGAESLETFYIPKTTDTIGADAFDMTVSLTTFEAALDNAHFIAVDGILYSKDMSTLLFYPANHANTDFETPAGVREINGFSFTGTQNLETLVLSDDVIKIGAWAFAESANLKTVFIPVSVTEIGEHAFADVAEDVVINAGADARPEGWHENWNPDELHVNWGQTND